MSARIKSFSETQRQAAEEYVDSQLEIMERFGSKSKVSSGQRADLIERILQCIPKHLRGQPVNRNSTSASSGAMNKNRQEREAFAWLYQWAGAINAPVSILDNLSALAQGEPVPHEWKYPVMPDEPAPAETPRLKAIDHFADVKLRSIEAMLGTLDHSPACDDEDWRDQVTSSVAALVEEVRKMRETPRPAEGCA